jgi:hypothetical protein
MAATMFHDIVLFVLAFATRKRGNAVLTRATTMAELQPSETRIKDNHMQSRCFSAMALRDRSPEFGGKSAS